MLSTIAQHSRRAFLPRSALRRYHAATRCARPSSPLILIHGFVPLAQERPSPLLPRRDTRAPGSTRALSACLTHPRRTLPLRTRHGTTAPPPLPASASPPRSALLDRSLPHSSASRRFAQPYTAAPLLSRSHTRAPSALSRPISSRLHLATPTPLTRLHSAPPRVSFLMTTPQHRGRIGLPVASRLRLATAHNRLLVVTPFPSCDHAAHLSPFRVPSVVSSRPLPRPTSPQCSPILQPPHHRTHPPPYPRRIRGETALRRTRGAGRESALRGGVGAAIRAGWSGRVASVGGVQMGTRGSVLTFTHGIGLSVGKESGTFPAPLALGLSLVSAGSMGMGTVFVLGGGVRVDVIPGHRHGHQSPAERVEVAQVRVRVHVRPPLGVAV
ncbi:hypothetical protein B0H14DRAFT_3519395 [Mycena olivaceomarginata]|nr:hypothetical protein B0H14DRAFT_3519395 [Mycena olivaceomarginata]